MTTTSKYQDELTKWAFETFRKKAKYDLRKKYTVQTPTMINEYVHDSTYAVTVQLKPTSIMHIEAAQRKLNRTFNEYCINILGPQCMDVGKLTSRTRQFLPLIFLAIDVEGTRHNAFSVMTLYPHGHGIIMFDEHTVFNFRTANARFRREDGSYEIVNPTREISKITLRPTCSIAGVKRYIHYSLKYAAKLRDNQINLRPYDFYPPTSVNYPFWQHLSIVTMHWDGLPPIEDEERDALERLWNGNNDNFGVGRIERRGKG